MRLQIPDFTTARVLVAGDLMLDRYWHGSTSRISPEAPVPVVRIVQSEDRPGGAGNVALNMAALGTKVTIMGLTGDDEAADILVQRLTAAGVECLFERIPNHPTITKLRVLSRHQQLIRLDFEEGFAGLDFTPLLQRFRAHVKRVDAVVLSDYGKGTLQPARALIDIAREAGKPVLVDPKGENFANYQNATLITPNLAEFESVVGPCDREQDLVDRGSALMEKHALEALLITRGEHGMTLLRRDMIELHLPAETREVFDVTGAGDTVISVLSAALASGQTLPEATALANIAAGIVVGKLGAACVNIPELRRAIQQGQKSGRGVVSEDQLSIAVQDARAHNESIVMTNGCFDILHAGHVVYLEQARKLGDRLIIAVNTDDSVRRLKGEGRPVNQLERRMAVLAALECVDWVVPFSEDTPRRLICHIMPDVLVKGGDNDPDKIPGGDCVRKAGGQVVTTDYLADLSTTGLISEIRSFDEGVAGKGKKAPRRGGGE